eukprot:TRINITY_DN7559_c0_g1_i1.p1 TRINITY_DN7559_c0_g1~~TRINITY_DN7559_c0_g1_i1.p1  ORF type:complete len:204 (+),score=33.90 TRINITY_DN7559_c0_g1_i1:40-612(+)
MNPRAIVSNVDAPDRLDLVISWMSSDGSRFGFYHLPGLTSMKVQPSSCALKVMLHYPRVVEHDFLQRSCVDVPVTLRVRNGLDRSCVSFLFETLAQEEEFDSSKRAFRQVNSISLSSRYLWHGLTTTRVNDLKPNEITHLHLNASFFQPGHYNLNRFRFTVEICGSSSSKPRVFFFPLQHLITIRQTRTT